MNVVFTKEIQPEFLAQLHPEINALNFTFLKIETVHKSEFQQKIEFDYDKYLISSQNAVHSIKELDLKGSFYVVGKTTSQLLKNLGFDVKCEFDYASQLAEFIIDNEPICQWNFFCGNNRRDELVQKLTQKGHKINEIVVYNSVQNPLDLNQQVMDAIGFFSPLGVQSYFRKNTLGDNTIIFPIGKTTAEEVSKFTKNKQIICPNPTVQSMIETINNYYYVEK